jgi:glycine oxidase
MTRAVVVGAGIVGCAVARELAEAGLSVTVLDRAEPVQEASHAAAGMLSPLAESSGPGPFVDLMKAARDRFARLALQLREETGIDVGYQDRGTLVLALDDEGEHVLEARFRWLKANLEDGERLSGAETLRLEPAVHPSVRWSLRFPGDHQVDNRALSRALWSAAVRSGADFRVGVEVLRLHTRGDRALAVEASGGERIAADWIVLAAGSWSGSLAGLPRRLPVVPVHGQLVAVGKLPPLFQHVVHSADCYIVPRSDGRLIIGATTERQGFRKVVTAGGILALLSAGVAAAPSISELPLIDCWSGLRPGTPDGLPILGPDPELPNLVYATGHYRNGILLAPITGEIIREHIISQASPPWLSSFAIDRFA